MKLTTQIGQQYVRRGHRLFAIPRAESLTDRIANRTQRRGNWDRIMTEHRTATVIRNG